VQLYHPGRTRAFIIAPTRELALKIAEERKPYLHTYHSKDLTFLCINGGSRMQRDTALLNKPLPTMLVATPGHLLDHIQETRVNGRQCSDMIRQTKIVVLDEMDRLLDTDFSRGIVKIFYYLPRAGNCQMLMFSAIIPKRL
jgi:ATP-dependent RNA helicase MSS116